MLHTRARTYRERGPHRRRFWPAVAAASVTAGSVVAGCAHGTHGDGEPSTEVPSFGGNAGTGQGPCVGLECQQVSCADGAHTTLSGVIRTPADDGDPVYNAVVYVPNAPVTPFAPGVACEPCGTITSGSPVVAALTGTDGRFVLTDAPAGLNIPVVFQVGRWRRQFVLPEVNACVDNPIPDGLTHLPSNRQEGEIPQIAIATGDVDPLECVLLKMGIDQSEFTTSNQGGRIHVYRSNGASMLGTTPTGDDLWSNLDALKRYDIVLLPCEGTPVYKPIAATQNLVEYSDLGGRVFTTHYGYVWIQGAPPAFASTADFTPDDSYVPSTVLVDINTSFPKGQALSDWLLLQGASPAPGEVPIHAARVDVAQTNGQSTPWLTSSSPRPAVQEYSFETPVNVDSTKQCGRVAYSDFHVDNTELVHTSASTFPSECIASSPTLTPQEKVIEFMLLDLASCIQKETDPARVPR